MGLPESELGPLPQGDRNAELQKLSLTALEGTLAAFVDRLWFRDERVDDTGVDGSLEVKQEGHHTNLRAQVQMKSTESPKFLKDGTATRQVETSNLNYLLNGPSPLYVIYILPTEELRYAWARDEYRRIEKGNPDWARQDTVTLHFREVINSASLDSIRNRIISEGRFSRQIHEVLVQVSATENATITVDPSSLEIVDPDDIAELLLEAGFGLINSGLSNEVVTLANQLPGGTRGKAGIRAVLAYADYMTGRYDSAIGQIAEAMLTGHELNDNERAFLVHLQLVCDYQRGRITPEELDAKRRELADEDIGPFRYYYRIESLRHQLLTEHDPQCRPLLTEKLANACLEIEAADDAGEYEKIQARLTRLLFEGSAGLMHFNREMAYEDVRSMVPAFDEANRGEVASADQALVAWQESVRKTIDEALNLGSPLLAAEALYVKLQIDIQALFSPFAKATMMGQQFALPAAALEAMERDWEMAVRVFHEAGILDRELQTKMLMPDVYEMIGRDAEAGRIASEVAPIAKVMGYTKTAELATETTAQRSLIREFKEALRTRLSDQDRGFAAMTDDEVKQHAAETATALGLPADRLGVIERDCVAIREAARQRLSWCRHIDVLQDKSHERSVWTLYARDPNRKCVCKKHGYETRIETPHWEGLLASLKEQHCESCPDRMPKGGGETEQLDS